MESENFINFEYQFKQTKIMETTTKILSKLNASERRKFKTALYASYSFLISILGLIIYLSFILDIPKIQIFNF